MNDPIQQVTLYYRDGKSSDKVVEVTLLAADGGYLVRTRWGKRAAPKFQGEAFKTKSPVSLEKAQSVYDKVVKEKLSEMYQPGPAFGTGYEPPIAGTGGTLTLPQLLNPIEREDVEHYLTDDEFVAQEKHDGVRFMLGREGASVYGVNRRGQRVSVPAVIARAAERIGGGDFLLDCERVKGVVHVFDALQANGEEIRSLPFEERMEQAGRLVAEAAAFEIQAEACAVTTEQKRALFAELEGRNAEGIVFKRRSAPYVPGRPPSGGDQVKFKFFETCTVRVHALNEQRSVEVAVLAESNGWLPVGNITIPVAADIPAVGTLIEVRYLYGTPTLVQTTYLGVRDDIDESEATFDQIKLKPQAA